MHGHLSRRLVVFVLTSFAAALSGTAFAASATQQHFANGAVHAQLSAKYCANHKMDPRCKK